MGVPLEDEVYMDEPWVTVRWDSTLKCVYMEWKAFSNSVQYRAAAMTALAAIRQKGSVAYISDTRKVKLIIPEDQIWIGEVWTPLALAAGLRRVAVVTAAAGLGKVTVEEAERLADHQGLHIHNFASVAAARRWISEGTRPESG